MTMYNAENLPLNSIEVDRFAIWDTNPFDFDGIWENFSHV